MSEELTVFQNEDMDVVGNTLIEIHYDKEDPTVSGRSLHEALQIETPYKKWFDRMTEYGFTEDVDFWTFLSESTGGRPSTDHELTIDMAKQLCMIQRTDIGRKFRDLWILGYSRPNEAVARHAKGTLKQRILTI